MRIKITGRDMVIVSPGECYDMPDYIANELIVRGKAEIAVVRPKEKPGGKGQEKGE